MSHISSSAFSDTKAHYDLLDGLRGVAALMVIWYHIFEGYAFAGGSIIETFNHGYLAVDFFFILSGFVIGYAYDDRWGRNLTMKNFFKRRLIRLHPMVIMGAVLGAITFCLQGCVQWDGTHIALSMIMLSLLCTIFFIPAMPGAGYEVRGNGEMFPLNGPCWSLFFEYLGNILYALFIHRLSNKALAVLTILFAFALARWQTNRLIKPINELDLERPLDSDIYEELSPLLEAMDRQNREKEAVANMRKEFSANVSHELKTPLTSISGYAEIMKNGLVRPEDISGFSERIYKEARRLITLIEDIIKLSKLDEESVELEKEDVDLYELTREIVSRLSPQAAQKNIRIELSGESVHYHGIRQILDEMVYNVCENAVKYNYENGKVSVWAGNTLNGPKISVSDTGIGIPKEHQERIFERFYRVDKSHSKERGGTGLGLSIVKHGALLHGAKVSVESEEGRGTKISMQFPRICQK